MLLFFFNFSIKDIQDYFLMANLILMFPNYNIGQFFAAHFLPVQKKRMITPMRFVL